MTIIYRLCYNVSITKRKGYMTKEVKIKKQYTAKQIAKALAPYQLIIVMVAVLAGATLGWTMRSDFDNTIREQVTAQVQEELKDQK